MSLRTFMAVLVVSALGLAGPSTIARAEEPKADVPKAPAPGSPRAVMMGFFQAFADGKAQVIRDSTLAESDDERAIVNSMTDAADAIARARKAVTAKFGVADKDLKTEMVPAEVLSRLEEKKVDDNTVSFGAEGEPVAVVKKVDGKWKMSIGDLVKQSGKKPDELVKEVREGGERLAKVTREIDVGTYANVDEAVRAIVKCTVRSRGPG